ncbi:MAG: sulfite exporter TauE/SafE family protein [Opitutales bacterium]
MTDALLAVDGALTAFIAGLVTSLHCAAMCGPIALLLAPRPGERTSFLTVTALYQGTRLLAITLGGALAGGLGMLVLDWTQLYQSSLAHYLPWLLVFFFLLLALRLDRLLPNSSAIGGLWGRMTKRFFKLPRPVAGVAAGLFTPFLPCGPLYLVFGLALVSQSPVRGAEFLLAFGLGTLPLLWLAQQQFHFWQRRVPPQLIDRIQRGVALAAAIIIAVRLAFFEAGSAGLFCG